MGALRLFSKIVSWVAVLVTCVAFALLVYQYITGKENIASTAVRDFIHYTLSGAAIGFIKINGQTIGDILNGVATNSNINIMIFYIILMAILIILLIIFAMSDSKIISIFEFILGVLVLLFVSWMVAIPLILAGFLKMITKKRI